LLGVTNDHGLSRHKPVTSAHFWLFSCIKERLQNMFSLIYSANIYGVIKSFKSLRFGDASYVARDADE